MTMLITTTVTITTIHDHDHYFQFFFKFNRPTCSALLVVRMGFHTEDTLKIADRNFYKKNVLPVAQHTQYKSTEGIVPGQILLAKDSMLSALYVIARPSICHTGGSVKNG